MALQSWYHPDIGISSSVLFRYSSTAFVLSLGPPTMPSISLLSSCGLAVARLCYFVSMRLRSFSSLSLFYNAVNALAFVPGAGVRGMKEAQAELSIHPNTHLWQTPGPHDSPRRPALQRANGSLLMTMWVEFIH
ncbi:hypothetical protein Q7C36_003871 [Tachysurus vachellii]|uniref:Uncharacterized protein n=1 Tax=Tachysurus vachellii TaxID=175792 RepID=A0AA88T5C8_TACVA|nr:hypothetical protein Q7C36_003871 [Tachysurus vachellii]